MFARSSAGCGAGAAAVRGGRIHALPAPGPAGVGGGFSVGLVSVNQPKFLDAVRDLLAEPRPEPTPPQAAGPDVNGRLALWHAGAQMIEALSQLAATDQSTWANADPVLRNRLHAGLTELLHRLALDPNNPSSE